MKIISFTYVVSAAILYTTTFALASAPGQHLSSGPGAASRSATETVVAQASKSQQRAIIIVSGKNSQPGPLNPLNKPESKLSKPGSKATLNPQPLPPKTSVNTSITSNTSKVMLNPQPLPPKSRSSR